MDKGDVRFLYVIQYDDGLVKVGQERWPALEGHREYFVGADFDEIWQYMRVLDAAAR